MAKIKLTQVKSVIDRTQKQKDTMKALGLHKIHASNEIEVSPQVLGMVEKVKHLITVEHI